MTKKMLTVFFLRHGVERPAGRRDVCRVVVQLRSANHLFTKPFF